MTQLKMPAIKQKSLGSDQKSLVGKTVSENIFEKFTNDIKEKGIDPTIADGLSVTLQSALSPSEQNIRQIMFPDTQNI